MKKPPHACASMADVRAGVDATDRAIVALLAERFGYMDAAARIKPNRDAVRDEARKREVLANVAREAAALGLEPGVITNLWDILVEASIAHEFQQWDLLRAAAE
ncbi:MAG: chorismate mutase [Sandaracinobacteroides sp.]